MDVSKRSIISDQLRTAILAAPVTCYRISVETGVSKAAISRFINKKRLLDLSSVDKIAAFLELELVPAKAAAKTTRNAR